MHADRMAGALIIEDAGGELRSGFEVGDAIEREHRRKLFTGERMLRSHAALRNNEKSSAVDFGPHETSKRCDRASILGDDGICELAVAEHFILQAAGLFVVEEQAALARQCG